MSNAIYPTLPGLAWTVGKQPGFNTLKQAAPNQYEVRIRQTANPIWTFSLVYEMLADNALTLQPGAAFTDLRTLMGFYLARQGMFDDFLFNDPTDNYSGPAMLNGAPNTAAELPLVTDGAGNYYSPIQRNFGGFLEDVTDLNGAITVYANGVATTNFSVAGPGLAIPGASYMGLYLQWSSGLATPVAPTLSSVSGGTLAAVTYYVKIAYTGSSGGAASSEASLAVAADYLLSVASPAASSGATGYNVYVSTTTGTETLQNSSPIAIGTAWTEPSSGLVTGGSAPPTSNNSVPTTPITAEFNFYFRVRFSADTQEFENFMYELWTIGGSESKRGSRYLELVTSRPNPL